MKVILLLLMFIPSIGSAQTWTTVSNVPYNSGLGFVRMNSGWLPGNQQFKVNPYDGTIWMAYQNFAHGFDVNGTYFKFDESNTPVFSPLNASTILDFEFTSQGTYLIDAASGILFYNGTTWSQLYSGGDSRSISSDKDSVWIGNENNTAYFFWKDAVPGAGSYQLFQRIVSRNGEMWGSTGASSGGIHRLVNDTPVFYSPDTSFLLDFDNFDFKFANNKDSLYTCGSNGISIAYNGAFIDTITPDNCTNMPMASVQEFEFDADDNIWALFGNDYDDISYLAYYDQNTESWSMIYDSSNSPIDWSGRVSIELDAEGNVYVVDNLDLHVLRVSNWPQWLDVTETELIHFEIYPNPSNGDLKIQIDESIEVSEIQILDLNGRVLESLPYCETLTINKQAGVYFVRLLNKDLILGTRKIVID